MTKKEQKPEGRAEYATTVKLQPKREIENLSRRSLLSWLGKSAVFALTADFLVACGEPEKSSQGDPNQGNPNPNDPDPGNPDTSNYPFNPSPEEGTLYDRWWGNTVDPQDLQRILTSWQLRVTGLVENPIILSFSNLLSLTRQDQITDFHCVEGWSVLDVPWNGFHINSLINLVRPTAQATHINLRSFPGINTDPVIYTDDDIYTESIPISVAQEPRTMFAFGIDGKTIPLTHGFPLRLVLPRMYGYKNAKWVKEIEFTNTPIDGYWVQRGYPTNAPVDPARLRPGKY